MERKGKWKSTPRRFVGGHNKMLVRIAAHSGGCLLNTRSTFCRKCKDINVYIGSKMSICKSRPAARIYNNNMQKP